MAPLLLINLGNLTFADESAARGLGSFSSAGSVARGAVVQDINGDGLLDMYAAFRKTCKPPPPPSAPTFLTSNGFSRGERGDGRREMRDKRR